MKAALESDARGISMHLFVRKNKDDKISREFYYLGNIHPTGRSEEFIMTGTTSSAVELEYHLDVPVPDVLYSYITG